MTDPPLHWGGVALWALPLYGVLLAVSTITQQPDYQTDFPAYARYVATTQFLVSHLLASIAGAGFGIIGAAALFVLTVRTAPGQARWGFALTAFGQAGLIAIFGVAAFFQPAIGRAFLEGNRAVAVGINEDVYGGPLFLTAGFGLLCFVAGGILLGAAARRMPSWPRRAGVLFASSILVFAMGVFVDVPFLQPAAGLGIAWAGVRLARAPRTAGDVVVTSAREQPSVERGGSS